MATADVWKGDRLVAHLHRHATRTSLAYVDDYTGPPIASTLPVRLEPYEAPAGQVPAFLAGLLPEGRRLSGLIRSLKVSADDEVSLLLAVGGDTVGDVRVLPPGRAPAEVPPIAEDWTELDLAAEFEASVAGAYDRSSMAGVQPKLSAGMISFPLRTTSVAALVKLNPPEYGRLVENEAAMLEVARASGLPTVQAALVIDGSGAPALAVVRFDRDGARRIAVEDGCQVLGRYPADKYLLDTVEVIEGLASRCTAPPVARLQLLTRFVASYLVGDGDLHAKNLSIFERDPGLWVPAPAYDLVNTALYDDWVLAAPFLGRENVRQLGRRRLLQAAAELGLREPAVTGVLDRLVPRIAAEVDRVLDTPTFASFPHLAKVRRELARRAEGLQT